MEEGTISEMWRFACYFEGKLFIKWGTFINRQNMRFMDFLISHSGSHYQNV